MVRIEKREVVNGRDQWSFLGEAKNYKEAIEKYNGVQGWWMKREHTFFIDHMWGMLCRMIKD